MNKKCATALLFCGFTFLNGCGPSGHDAEMAMKQPERPAELDRLEPWIGRWTGTGEMKMIGGKVVRTTGNQEYTWDLDRRVMLAKETWNMEGLGPMRGVGIYGYDPVSKKIRSSSYDDWGNVSTALFRYDEKNNMWHMKYNGRGAYGSSSGKGTITMPDRDTINYTFEEYFGLIKVMEATGTSKRQP